MHLTCLPGDNGIGELGHQAKAFIDQLRTCGIGVWQFLPLGPTAYADSPYQPLSSFAGNPMLVSIAELQSLGLLHGSEVTSLQQLPRDSVDFGRLIPLKTELLLRAAERFESHAPAGLRQAYEEFRHRHDATWLNEYALFRVLKTAHNERPWSQWNAALARRDARALRSARIRYAHDIRMEKVVQFYFHHQWSDLHAYAQDRGVALMGDIPIYIALDSADAWTGNDILLLDDSGEPTHVAGVPPDYFSEDGQLWGNPLYDWSHHRDTGFAWWLQRFSHCSNQVDLVRVDHFRGFEAFWSIPRDADNARHGSWVKAPGDELFAVLRAELSELTIVAEDLGVITPGVDKLRHDYDIPGMVVLQFDAVKPEFDLEHIQPRCVCYTGTHDNDTTVGWFRGGRGDTRTAGEIARHQKRVLEVTGGTPETIHLDLVRLAFDSPARIAMVPMQDYLGLGSAARMNTPGTLRNNWRWRMLAEQFDPPAMERIAELVDNCGRRSEQGVNKSSQH